MSVVDKKFALIKSKLNGAFLLAILFALIIFLNCADKNHKEISKYQLLTLEPITVIIKGKSYSRYYIDLYDDPNSKILYLTESFANENGKKPKLDIIQWLDPSKRQNLISSSEFSMKLKRYQYYNSLEQVETRIRLIEAASKRKQSNKKIPLNLRTQTLFNLEKQRQAKLAAQEKRRLEDLSK